MRVLTCLAYEHNPLLLLLAALLCLFGSSVTIRLAHRTVHARGTIAMHWLFLAGVCAGFSIWATHFIAMLGYRPGVPVHFDATLTIVSALIAIAGTAIGLGLARLRDRGVAVLCGGGVFGLAISAMHYAGMFAYRPDGIVRWDPALVAFSVLSAVSLAAVAIHRLRAKDKDALGHAWDATLLLVAAILVLHFAGMAAFEVVPIAGHVGGPQSEVFTAMASAIAIAAVVIVGTGVSAHLFEEGRAEAQEYLRRIATRDMLTGLHNRHSFVTHLQEECAQLETGGQPFALLLIDLDRFKAVNDTMGHPAGDALLKSVAMRLTEIARGGDVVCRIGGDEFAMIAQGIDTQADALRLADAVVRVLSTPFRLEAGTVAVGASVGIAMAPRSAADAEILTQQADNALYRAKGAGRGRSVMFDGEGPRLVVPAHARLPKSGIDRAALEYL